MFSTCIQFITKPRQGTQHYYSSLLHTICSSRPVIFGDVFKPPQNVSQEDHTRSNEISYIIHTAASRARRPDNRHQGQSNGIPLSLTLNGTLTDGASNRKRPKIQAEDGASSRMGQCRNEGVFLSRLLRIPAGRLFSGGSSLRWRCTFCQHSSMLILETYRYVKKRPFTRNQSASLFTT